jgi:hypothetical protein
MFGMFKKTPVHEPVEVQRKEAETLCGALCTRGEDCDKVAGGHGLFGSITNPIPVNGPIGELKYLTKLRGKSGKAVMFHRVGSFGSPVVEFPVDQFEVVCMDGSQWGLLSFDSYHPRRSNLPPDGYTLVPFNAKIGGDVPYGFGCTGLVQDFPQQLPNAIRRMFGEHPGAGFASVVSESLKRYAFQRPPLKCGEPLATFVLGAPPPAETVAQKDLVIARYVGSKVS